MANERGYAGLVIGTAGHVDHGKSSLVRALTGVETDTLAEERRRGLTIDLGFAPISFDDGLAASIVDVPGHEKFIKNMLAGATGVDLALIVVAADDGIRPQTTEHVEALTLLGVDRGVVAITKCDLVGPERIVEVREDVAGLLKGTPLESSPVVEVSSVSGAGIHELKRALRDALAAPLSHRKSRAADGWFRLPVDRSFVVAGFGAVVTGTVASGTVAKGDGLVRLPGGESVKVRGIESLNAAVDSIGPGRRAAINVTGLGHAEMRRGDLLAAPELASAAGIKRVDCFLEFTGKRRPGSGASRIERGLFRVHHLTADADCTVRLLPGSSIEPGARAFGRLFLKSPLTMLRGDRFILRSPAANTIVGGGVVYMPYLPNAPTPPLKSAPPAGGPGDIGDDAAAVAYLFSRGIFAVDEASLLVMLNKRGASFAVPDGYARSGGFIVDLKSVDATMAAISEETARRIASDPLRRGVEEAALYKTFEPGFARSVGVERGRALFGSLVDRMASQGRLVRSGALLMPPLKGVARGDATGAAATLAAKPSDERIRRVVEAVAAFFERAGFTPPELSELKAVAHDKAEMEASIKWLVESGALVRLKYERYMAAPFVEKARLTLLEMAAARGSIKAAEFRDALGCGRRAAIELLEHFDSVRLTLRKGDERVLRAG